MFNTKRFLAVALMGMAMIGNVKAQKTDKYMPFPHGFIGVQGGLQTTVTHSYSPFKLATPTASIYGGCWFTPVVGARLHVNGMWNQGGMKNVGKYDYKYVTTNVDLLLNLMTMFGRKQYYPVNVYLLGGIGLNPAWDNDDAIGMNARLGSAWDGTLLSHNARVGAQIDINLCRNVSLNLEGAANSLRDSYNSKRGGGDDWQFTGQIGLTFKFGHKKPKVVKMEKIVEPIREEVWETRIDTTWYDDVEYVDVTRDREIRKDIFFGLNSDAATGSFDEQVDAVANFLKGVQNSEITIEAYSDKGTGTAKDNLTLSKKRANMVKQALLDRGVDASIIKSVTGKGDTEQPYAENDKNRVCIIKGHGVYTDKDRKPVKKFRTEQVRYRVK